MNLRLYRIVWSFKAPFITLTIVFFFFFFCMCINLVWTQYFFTAADKSRLTCIGSTRAHSRKHTCKDCFMSLPVARQQNLHWHVCNIYFINSIANFLWHGLCVSAFDLCVLSVFTFYCCSACVNVMLICVLVLRVACMSACANMLFVVVVVVLL